MVTAIRTGQRSWSMSRDPEGHRTYKIKYLIQSDPTDGPAQVLLTPGIPRVGSIWDFQGDFDIWAWCRPDITITPAVENEANTLWYVEQTFSTKPPDRNMMRPQTGNNPIEDPILEPPKINGTGVKYTEEALYDRFGKPIITSSFEQLRGPQVEFDKNRTTITIEFNVATFAEVSFAYSFQDTLNDAPLWGFAARQIKLSLVTFERKFFQGSVSYFTIKLEFDCRPDGFDRDLLDEGTKALNGHWDQATGLYVLDNIGGNVPSRSNPTHFTRFKGRDGNPTKVILDGAGLPINTHTAGPVENASSTSPIVITSTAHGLTTGNIVAISGVLVETLDGGSTYNAGINAPDWTVTVIDANSFSLNGSLSSSDLLNGYIGGGIWYNLSAKPAGNIHVEKYDESNFLLLGIPTSFDVV